MVEIQGHKYKIVSSKLDIVEITLYVEGLLDCETFNLIIKDCIGSRLENSNVTLKINELYIGRAINFIDPRLIDIFQNDKIIIERVLIYDNYHLEKNNNMYVLCVLLAKTEKSITLMGSIKGIEEINFYSIDSMFIETLKNKKLNTNQLCIVRGIGLPDTSGIVSIINNISLDRDYIKVTTVIK